MGRSGCDRLRRNYYWFGQFICRKRDKLFCHIQWGIDFSQIYCLFRCHIQISAEVKCNEAKDVKADHRKYIYDKYIMWWIKQMFLFWWSQSFCSWASRHLSACGKLWKCQPCKHWAQFWVFFLLFLIKSYWHWNFLVKHKVI